MSLAEDLSWWEKFRDSDAYRRLQSRPVAYFCAEFALISNLKTYSGGLGVLAGDILREAADQKFPMVGVGLLYDQSTTIDDRKWKMGAEDRKSKIENKKSIFNLPSSTTTFYPPSSTVDSPSPGLEPVLTAGQPLTVRVPIQDRYVTVSAFRYPAVKLGRGWWSGGVRTAPVYLLTTDCPDNDPRDCCITDQLYPPEKEKRLQQEIILGLGGLRLLEALGIHPAIYHLNEGHSAFLAIEIIRHEMSERLISFDAALELARRRVVFTNHTLVPAGHDVYSNDLVAANLSKYAEELAVPVDRLVRLGLVQESSLFSMTILSLRLAGKTNAVSRLHARKAAEIWTDHPMIGITNGIHRETWDKIKNGYNGLNGYNGSGFNHFSHSSHSNHSAIWDLHQHHKRRLLSKVFAVTGQQWPEDCLLLGWARRFVSYKRPLSLFFDPVWLRAICTRPDRPVRLVISGNPQEGDLESEKLLAELASLRASPSDGRSVEIRPPGIALAKPWRTGEATGGQVANARDDGLSQIFAYLPNYNMELAQLLTAGCDVWLNTPVTGFEACGTSGMKAGLNGVLPISTKDGWMAEIDPVGIGWLIDSDRVSAALYETLEHQVIPLYFDYRQEWIKNMAKARQLILDHFTTTRTLKEYVEKLYL